ncbi:DUF4838 domain-containing protein [bacterium]|nr:DUF4838 domain-containing protein [bacterium]
MRTLMLTMAVLGCLAAVYADFPVVQGGQAKCQIVLGKGAQPVEKDAAADLGRCLKVMTGVAVPLVAEGVEQAGVPKILVGPCALPDDVMKAVAGRDYGGYIIRQVGADLVLRGPSEYGSSNAIYGLLEDTLSCHWYMPSELFESIPQRAEVVLPALDVAVNPGFRFRYFSGVSEGGIWQYRNRLDRPGNPNAPFLAQGHILYALYPPSKYGKTHPDYYPLIAGKRHVNSDDQDQFGQPCTSNPEVVQVAVDTISRFFDTHPQAHTHSLCINDNNTWCECDACRAQDVEVPRFRGRTIYSDRYYTYVNAVARGLAAKHPDQFLGVFAYAGVEPVPAKIAKIEPNVYVSITQDCSQHFDAAYRQTDYDFIRQWQSKAAHVGKYDYYGLGAIIPRYTPHLIARDIRHSQQVGLEGFHSEAYPLWANFGPQIYVAAQMLYNPKLDCDKLLRGYFADLYGPAAGEMAALYETFENAWMSYERPGKWFEGISSMAEQISMYKPEHLAAVRAHLRRARQLADSDLIRQRIAYVDQGLEYPLNAIEGWLAAEKLNTMRITAANSAEAVRLIKQVNRCVDEAPRLWQRSIMDDPISTNWYKQGARPTVIGQWVSHCQDATIGAVTELANSNAPGDVLADVLAGLKGTDTETIMRVYQGELDAQPSLLPNGSFESTEGVKDDQPTGPEWTSEGTPPGWSTWKIDPSKGKLYLDAGKPHAGKLAAAIQGGDCVCYITTVPVEAGRRYAAWTYAFAEKADPKRRTTLEVRWQDKGGKWFSGGLNTLTAVRQPGRWERLVSVVTAPEGAAKAVILLVVYDMPEGEKAWFDDASVVAVE